MRVFDIKRFKPNPAPPMQTTDVTPSHISRSAFQWILHQALVADERYVYRGLIGASEQDSRCIEKVAMVKDEQDIEHTLEVWNDLGMKCLGFFHFENEDISATLLSQMPSHYIELQVRLAEKGRLDLLAFSCDKESGDVVKVNLDLIEDGQSD